VQQRLLEELSLTPRHIDAIAFATEMTATEAGVQMTLLELSGHVRRLPGNSYIRAL
jgi:predicted Rossmann fold nucleotide-binding protein DprA/Smf involved in DNA uptake